MPSRIEDILIRARDTLADPYKERWDDARLLRLVDEAQKTIVLQARLLRTKTEIPVLERQAVYSLPGDSHRYIRVLDENQQPLRLLSHEQADKELGPTWETRTGTKIEAVIFDKQNTGQFKVYPIPLYSSSIPNNTQVSSSAGYLVTPLSSPYGVTVTGEAGDSLDTVFGVVANISYVTAGSTAELGKLTPEFGFVSHVEDIDYTIRDQGPEFGIAVTVEAYNFTGGLFGIAVDLDPAFDNIVVESSFGFLQNIIEGSFGLTVYYLKKPNTISSISDELEIDSVFDRAIKFYVTGMALRDDKDTQNRTIGAEELQFFQVELRQAIKDTTQDFTQLGTQYRTTYIGAFD